jgi:DNA topoisomerase-2
MIEKINIDLSQYEIHKIDSISHINKETKCIDLTIENDHTFHIKHELGYMLTHNCFGISIKGLLINFIHKMWPELLELGFCYEFITPIVKATKGKVIKEYYDIDKYKRDKVNDKLNGFTIKYYKGLGTITAPEIKEMFKNIDKHLIKFKFIDKRDSDKIDLVFNKTRANERKEWMTNYKGEILPDKFGKPNNINDFIDTEFIQFSNYDNIISIPHLIDGFKPSQRKIMFGAFKRNLKAETKVAQFGAYVAEQTHYAHGESNMYGTIINMAQDFVFSNNISMFIPKGNFGSRRDPKSAASPRYIYTYLNPITSLIFRKEDEQILNYLYEDVDRIEPEYFLPIIPTLLVNGTSGIGTGWSTDVPKYDPMALIQVIQKKLTRPDIKYAINPSYNKWNGDLDWDAERNTYISKGIFTLSKNKLQVLITELPVDVSTDKYISILDKLCDDKIIKTYLDNSTDELVHITITLNAGTKINNLESLLKLTANISINNMNTFLDNKIVKWNTAEELLNTWFDLRLQYYIKRKESYIKILEKQYIRYFNLVCFIKAVIDGAVLINNKSKSDIIKNLEDMEFDKYNDNYDYLLNIPVYHLSKEKYDEYRKQAKDMKLEIKLYKLKTPEEIWNTELDELNLSLKKAGY